MKFTLLLIILFSLPLYALESDNVALTDQFCNSIDGYFVNSFGSFIRTRPLVKQNPKWRETLLKTLGVAETFGSKEFKQDKKCTDYPSTELVAYIDQMKERCYQKCLHGKELLSKSEKSDDLAVFYAMRCPKYCDKENTHFKGLLKGIQVGYQQALSDFESKGCDKTPLMELRRAGKIFEPTDSESDRPILKQGKASDR